MAGYIDKAWLDGWMDKAWMDGSVKPGGPKAHFLLTYFITSFMDEMLLSVIQ